MRKILPYIVIGFLVFGISLVVNAAELYPNYRLLIQDTNGNNLFTVATSTIIASSTNFVLASTTKQLVVSSTIPITITSNNISQWANNNAYLVQNAPTGTITNFTFTTINFGTDTNVMSGDGAGTITVNQTKTMSFYEDPIFQGLVGSASQCLHVNPNNTGRMSAVSTDCLLTDLSNISNTSTARNNLGVGNFISTSTWKVNASSTYLFSNNWGGSSTIWLNGASTTNWDIAYNQRPTTTIATNLNQLTNGPGFISTSTWTVNASGSNVLVNNWGGSSTIWLSLAAASGFTDAATSTSAGVFTVATTSAKITITIPPKNDAYFAPSSTIPGNTNQLVNGANFVSTVNQVYFATSSVAANWTTFQQFTTLGVSSTQLWSTSSTLGTALFTSGTSSINLALSYSTASRCLRLDANKNVVASTADCAGGDTGFTDFATTTAAGVFTVATTTSKITLTIPPAKDQYFAPSSTITVGAIATSTWVVNASGGIMFANNYGGSSTIWANVSTTITPNAIATSSWLVTASGTNTFVNSWGGSSTVWTYSNPSTTIPTNTTQLTNGANFVTTANQVYFATSSVAANWTTFQQFTTLGASSTQLWSASSTLSNTTYMSGIASTTQLSSGSSTFYGVTNFRGAMNSTGTVDTVGASNTTCGTTPSILGANGIGRVTTGTNASSTCTITFGIAFLNKPVCVISSEVLVANSTTSFAGLPTATTLKITATASSSDMKSKVFDYVCIGIN